MLTTLRSAQGGYGIVQASRIYLGLATVTAATVFVEIIITRIFSVVLYYHFAFVAISLAMLGMAGGAMYVYLRRDRYEPHESLPAMGRLTAYLATSLVVAYLLALGVGFEMSLHPAALVSLGLIVGFWAVPFFVSGMVVSIALTRVPLPVGRLYAADLAGAALGCLLVQPALSSVGPPASVGLAALAMVLAAEWMTRAQPRASRRAWWRSALAVGWLVGFVVLCVAAPVLFSPKWIKGSWEADPERVFWNSYSRVAVFPPETREPRGGGLGYKLPTEKSPSVTTRWQNIDAKAATWITQFDGDLEKHQYLAYDVVNAVYHLRPKGALAVIGVGGGRDLLSAMVGGDYRIVGIELNEVFPRLLHEDYAAFSGNIANRPNVRLVVAEARNWLERTSERFDIIQVTLIDTWAASAAGAYALSENTLYTVEGWRTFLRRLTPNGVLSVSRWYSPDTPAESYRLAAVAEAALTANGQREPDRCVAIVTNQVAGQKEGPWNIGTLLVSPSPLSADDTREIEEVADRCGFRVLYSPARPAEPYAALLDPARSAQWQRSYLLDISPPTDDRPYFFHMIRGSDAVAVSRWRALMRTAAGGGQAANITAVLVLTLLGLSLLLATLALTIVPLFLHEGRGVWRTADWVAALYFAGIGLGFMIVEIVIIQRTGMILGHPIYGLQVTLFSLLLGSGVGSLLSSELPGRDRTKARGALLLIVVATAVVIATLGPLAEALSTQTQPVRIVAVALVVLAVGLFMGTAFPTGLAVARARGREELLPWLWGMNGVCSVLGAFLGTACSLFVGMRVTGLLGAACYVVACAAIWWYTSALQTDRQAV